MGKFWSFAAGAVMVAAICSGCYEYPKPPSATLGDSYTQRERDKAEEMFKDIKRLTLADAQRIAIQNNPNYISASQSIEAARFRYYQAIGAYSPTLSASFGLSESHTWKKDSGSMFTRGTGQRERDNNYNTSTSLRASLLIFDGLAREFNVLASKRGVKYYEALEDRKSVV